MLNHTYTSVKNANLVDCGKKQHISSQPISLLKDNFLGEFRTDLEKKKVLANLGIATELSLEWQYIKGDIGGNQALADAFKYISKIDNIKKTLSEGINYLEEIIGGELEGETEQNNRLSELEKNAKELYKNLGEIQEYLDGTLQLTLSDYKSRLDDIDIKIANINDLIKISSKSDNALVLIPEDSNQLVEGETPGLYVPNLEPRVEASEKRFEPIETNIESIQSEIESVKNNYVTKESLGGEEDFNFVKQVEYNSYVNQINTIVDDILTELNKTVKTGADGHVDTLYVNKISKNNDESHIQIEDSFEITKGIPLDVRFVVEDLTLLLQLSVKVCYPGMGVIVNSLSALYILRNPEEGIVFNLDYVSNVYNWKCPEDLVTIALSRSEYEKLEEINPNVFYYIYEEEIERTKEPVRTDYDTEEEFQVEWQAWVNSLKVLSQEYMSASWGVEIEDKLGKKASQDSVSFLISEIDKIKGSGDGTSLESLNTDIQELQTFTTTLESQIHNIFNSEDSTGRLIDAESRIEAIEANLPDYITEEELTTLSGGFNFVKPDVYENDKQTLLNNLAQSITTESVIANTINLSGSVITSSEGNIQVNDAQLAKVSDLPVILVMTQADYDNLDSKDDDTYYYTYDDDIIYVTKLELDTKVSKLQQDITTLLGRITTLESLLEHLLNLSTETPEDSES